MAGWWLVPCFLQEEEHQILWEVYRGARLV
jgi:hypothetical protein